MGWRGWRLRETFGAVGVLQRHVRRLRDPPWQHHRLLLCLPPVGLQEALRLGSGLLHPGGIRCAWYLALRVQGSLHRADSLGRLLLQRHGLQLLSQLRHLRLQSLQLLRHRAYGPRCGLAAPALARSRADRASLSAFRFA